MGADFYLQTVLHACHTRYGRVHQLADEVRCLIQGDLQHVLSAESQHLKAALSLHAQQTGMMDTILFDLVAEIADVAQGEYAVSTVALAQQIAVLIRQQDDWTEETTATVGESGAACLVQDLLDLLQGHREPAITHGVNWLAHQLATAEQQATPEQQARTQALANLGRSMVELLHGNPTSALTILVERQMIPQIKRACADQLDCLNDLTNALDPIMSPACSTSPEGTDFTPGQVLAQWSDLVRRFHEATTTLHEKLTKTLHLPVFESALVTLHLVMARAHIETLKHEGEALMPQMETAMGTLGTLLMRTLPSDFGQDSRTESDTSVPISIPSPLRQTVGTILRHQIICGEAVHLIEQCIHVTQQVLGGETAPALLEICRGMVALLYADLQKTQEHEPKEPLSQTITKSISPSVPLAPGVMLLPGTVMDMCYVQIQATIYQSQHHQRIQEWVQNALTDEQATTGSILRFWQLLLEEPTPWVILLAALLREMLQRQADPTPEHTRVMSLVEQFQDLLREQPASRLQALCTELREKIPSTSPLVEPAERLLQLAQGQISSYVAEAFAHMSQEVEHAADWPEECKHDLQLLLDLGHACLHSSQEQHPLLLLSTLFSLCDASQPCEMSEVLRIRLVAALACPEAEDVRLRAVQPLLDELPELGPLPPNTDPRLSADWRFRLLRDLIARQVRLEEASAQPTMEHDRSSVLPETFPLLALVLKRVQRMLHAWLFPENGYFRDPYNDTSVLWVATSAFWPAIADQITEPLDKQNQSDSSWLASEITAQIPLADIRALVDLLTDSDLRLPSQEHLARWGHAIRVEETGPYSLSAWYGYFEQRRQTLLAFLTEAITREEPILCSL